MIDIEETWLVTKYGAYEASNLGRIRRKSNKFILKPALTRNGYHKLSISNENGRKFTKNVHRLIAETWLPNSDNLPQVNHKDGDKTNNKKTNLEWATASSNTIHAYETGLNKNTNPLRMFNKENNSIRDFRSLNELSIFLDIATVNLLPIIKHSDEFPIYGKYTVTVNDIDSMLKISSTIDKGTVIYVYDTIAETVNSYPSLRVASYFTGIRNLLGTVSRADVVYKNGYYLSTVESLVSNIEKSLDKEIILAKRIKSLSKSFEKRLYPEYILYDYFTKEEKYFPSVKELTAYLSVVDGSGRVITDAAVLSAMAVASKYAKNASGLIKGYGVKEADDQDGWFNYSEEDILRSKINLYGHPKIYKVTMDGVPITVYGKQNLGKLFNVKMNLINRLPSVEALVSYINRPGLTIERLNKPML